MQTKRISGTPVDDDPAPQGEVKGWAHIWERLVRLGLGETALRIGTSVASLLLFLAVIWIMSNFYVKGPANAPVQAGLPAVQPGGTAPAAPTAAPAAAPVRFEAAEAVPLVRGIPRLALVHTTLPARPRFEIDTYTVLEGDTIFGIAEKFSIRPQTILWGNYDTLADDPERLIPGQTLNILPTDGVLYKWHTGDGINGVAKFFGISPEDIIDWPGNHLSRDTIGDWAAPNIPDGTLVVIPGGTREFASWEAPRVVRTDPGAAKGIGTGVCGSAVNGAVGIGAFIWPTTERRISGYHYSPETNHRAIDIGGRLGNPIWSVDNGVVVYAGWSDLGYGNMVMIDHGNGWQSLYAHLSEIYVTCGMSLYQGAEIGAMGSTGRSSGPHLHIELRSDVYGKVDPMNFLQ